MAISADRSTKGPVVVSVWYGPDWLGVPPSTNTACEPVSAKKFSTMGVLGPNELQPFCPATAPVVNPGLSNDVEYKMSALAETAHPARVNNITAIGVTK